MQQETTRERIATNVRVELTRRRVENATIAEVIGKSPASTSERLTGKTNFRIEELEAIARFLDVPLDTLVTGSQTTTAVG